MIVACQRMTGNARKSKLTSALQLSFVYVLDNVRRTNNKRRDCARGDVPVLHVSYIPLVTLPSSPSRTFLSGCRITDRDGPPSPQLSLCPVGTLPTARWTVRGHGWTRQVSGNGCARGLSKGTLASYKNVTWRFRTQWQNDPLPSSQNIPSRLP